MSFAHGTRRLVFRFAPFIGLLVVLVGMAVLLILIRRNQDIRNKAFTGYSLTTDAGNSSRTDVLQFASPGDLDVRPELENTSSSLGLYYTLSHLYQNDHPEMQRVTEPTLHITGKVFMQFDVLIDKTVVFMRLENLPLVGKRFIHVWKSTKDGKYISLGIGEVSFEDGIPVTYAVYSGAGDLHINAQDLILSYDSTVKRNEPETIILKVHF